VSNHRRSLDSSYPFLGLGISAAPSEAEEIALAILAGGAEHLPDIQMLNVGVSTAAPPSEHLKGLLHEASLGCVAHLEELNLVGELDEKLLEQVLDACEVLSPSWIQEDLGVWVWKGGPLGAQMIPPILDERSLDQASENLERILRRAPVPFLAENPPFYFVVGELDLLSYMERLAERTGCGLVFDIGHFIGYCACVGEDPSAYLGGWGGARHVVEVHVAGYEIMQSDRGALWVDDHAERLAPLSLEILGQLLSMAGNVKAVTVEVEAAAEDVLRDNVLDVAERIHPVHA